jgi:hypothetical protein
VPVQATPGGNKQLGYQMAIQRGWADQWTDIDFIVTHESGWRADAQNPSSAACGIAQNINGCGAYPDPSPAGQIAWMYDYFQTHCSAWQGQTYCYHGPAGAAAFKRMAGWY